jgi:hypothetical protein
MFLTCVIATLLFVLITLVGHLGGLGFYYRNFGVDSIFVIWNEIAIFISKPIEYFHGFIGFGSLSEIYHTGPEIAKTLPVWFVVTFSVWYLVFYTLFSFLLFLWKKIERQHDT